MATISYDQVVDLLFELLPELVAEHDREFDYMDGERLPYLIYGILLDPLIERLLDANEDTQLTRIFGFIENLATNGDDATQNLVAVGILEHFLYTVEYEILLQQCVPSRHDLRVTRAFNYMGPATMQLWQAMDQHMSNLTAFGSSGLPIQDILRAAIARSMAIYANPNFRQWGQAWLEGDQKPYQGEPYSQRDDGNWSAADTAKLAAYLAIYAAEQLLKGDEAAARYRARLSAEHAYAAENYEIFPKPQS